MVDYSQYWNLNKYVKRTDVNTCFKELFSKYGRLGEEAILQLMDDNVDAEERSVDMETCHDMLGQDMENIVGEAELNSGGEDTNVEDVDMEDVNKTPTKSEAEDDDGIMDSIIKSSGKLKVSDENDDDGMDDDAVNIKPSATVTTGKKKSEEVKVKELAVKELAAEENESPPADGEDMDELNGKGGGSTEDNDDNSDEDNEATTTNAPVVTTWKLELFHGTDDVSIIKKGKVACGGEGYSEKEEGDEGCKLAACSRWRKYVDGKKTDVTKDVCMDCQEMELYGWPAKARDYPERYVTDEYIKAISKHCTDPKNPFFSSPQLPSLPRSNDAEVWYKQFNIDEDDSSGSDDDMKMQSDTPKKGILMSSAAKSTKSPFADTDVFKIENEEDAIDLVRALNDEDLDIKHGRQRKWKKLVEELSTAECTPRAVSMILTQAVMGLSTSAPPKVVPELASRANTNGAQVEDWDKARTTLSPELVAAAGIDQGLLLELFSGKGFTKADLHEENWDKQFQKLIKYHEETGNWRPAQSTSLGSWVMNQARAFVTNELPKRRKEKLKSIGFEFKVDTDQKNQNIWFRNFTLLADFLDTHDQVFPNPKEVIPIPEYLRLPSDKKTTIDIGNWVKIQKQAYAKDDKKVDDRRAQTNQEVKLLSSIGIERHYTREMKTWDETYDKVLKFRENNNNKLPRLKAKDKAERALGQWIENHKYKQFKTAAFPTFWYAQERLTKFAALGLVNSDVLTSLEEEQKVAVDKRRTKKEAKETKKKKRARRKSESSDSD